MRTIITLAALCAATPSYAQTPGAGGVPIDRVLELLAERAPPSEAAWRDAAVEVALPAGQGPATITLTSVVHRNGPGDVIVGLVPAGVALREVDISGADAGLVQHAGRHALRIRDEGWERGEIRLVFEVATTQTPAGARLLQLPLPGAPSSALTISGVAPGGIEVAPAVRTAVAGDALQAWVPAAGAVAIRWGGLGGAHDVRAARFSLRPDGSGDGVDVDATLEVHAHGPGARVRIAPASVALMAATSGGKPLVVRVEEGWHRAVLTAAGPQRIDAKLRLAIDRSDGQPQVALSPAGAAMVSIQATIPGQREVSLAPEAPVRVRVRGAGRTAVTVATAAVAPTDELVVRWTETRSAPEQLVRVSTETYQLVTLEEGAVRSRVIVDAEVMRGRVKELDFQIPDDAVLFRVIGEGIDDWRTFAASGDSPRHVRLQLGDEIEGRRRLELHLEQVAPRAEGAAVAVPVVRPLRVWRESGVVALFDGDKVGFAQATPKGFTQVGEDALPSELRKELTDKVRQAFKHVGGPAEISTKVAAAEERKTRFDAHVDALYTVEEGTLLGHATVLVEVKSGRRDTVVVSLPEAVSEPRITAPSLNKVRPAETADGDPGPGRKAWVVRFTQALQGAIELDVEYEVLLPKELGAITLPDLRVEGAEVQDGSFGVAAVTGIEVQATDVTELRRVAPAELPNSVRLRSEREVLLGYRYVHPSWALALDVVRHDMVDTLKAVARRVWMRTDVHDSGHVVTTSQFEVANEDQQYLRLTLPDGARVLSVTAGDKAIKAVQDKGGAIAVPLPTGETTLVKVVWELARGPLGGFGWVDLQAPAADLRQGRIQWLVRTPQGLSLHGLSTSLKEGEVFTFDPPTTDGDGLTAARERLFSWEVQDPKDAALTVRFAYSAVGTALGNIALLLALLLLVWGLWRRWTAGGFGRGERAAVAAGTVLLVAVMVSGCTYDSPGPGSEAKQAGKADQFVEVLVPEPEASDHARVTTKLGANSRIPDATARDSAGAATAPDGAPMGALDGLLGALGGSISGRSKEVLRPPDDDGDKDNGGEGRGEPGAGQEVAAAAKPRTGYFDNTYLGGNAAHEERLRNLRGQLGDDADVLEAAGLPPQPFDPPRAAALGLTVHLDRRWIGGPGKVLLQMGLQGSRRYGWRRPPLDVALVIDSPLLGPSATVPGEMVQALLRRLSPRDRLAVTLVGAREPLLPLDAAKAHRSELARALDALQVERASGPDALGAAMTAAGDALSVESSGRVPGTRIVLVLAGDSAGAASLRIDAARIAADALGQDGIVTSVVEEAHTGGWWPVAAAGHGQYHALDLGAPEDVVQAELDALARVVARLVRINVKLAPGVQLIRVVGSHMLDSREAAAVKAREEETDRRLSDTLGVQTDRGDDDDGLQTVIPYFLGGDSHVLQLELSATAPGPIADVTLRYKDMITLDNAAARASTWVAAVPRPDTPAQLLVQANRKGFELAHALAEAGASLRVGDQTRANANFDTALLNATDDTDRRLIQQAQDVAARSSGEDAWKTLKALGDLRVGGNRR